MAAAVLSLALLVIAGPERSAGADSAGRSGGCRYPNRAPVHVSSSYWVDPLHGDDCGPGTLNRPFKTLDRARRVVNDVKTTVDANMTVNLRGATYRLSAPFVLGAQDSGVNGHTITYQAYRGEPVVMSGGVPITGWQVEKKLGVNTIYRASAKGLNFAQLYIDNHPATLARFPDAGTELSTTGWDNSGDPLVRAADVPAFTNEPDNPVQFKGQARWIDIQLPIASVRTDGSTATITATDPARQPAANMQPGVQGSGNPYHFQNAYQFLSVPGEWYLDRDNNTVYLVAPRGTSPGSLHVVAPRLEDVVQFSGTLDNPIHDVTFAGITVQDTTWLAPQTDGFFWGSWQSFPSYLDASGVKQPDWAHALMNRPHSAVLIQDAQRITFRDGTIRNTGGDGIFLRESQDNTVLGNDIYDIGYHGVEAGMFQNYSSDVYAGVDYEHGNPTDPRVIEDADRIADNYVTRVGTSIRMGIGIKLGWISNTVIEHNEIYDVPYSGMMLGNGKPGNDSILGGIKVLNNDVARNNTVLSDGAAIYAYAKHNPKTLVQGNYLHDGYYSTYEDLSNILGLYFDDGSNGFTVIGNLVSNEVSGEINGGEAEHVALGDVFSGNQPTDPATVQQLIDNAGLPKAYQHLRLAPSSTHYPGPIRVQAGDNTPLTTSFTYAPGWTVYYTTDGSTPTKHSPIANGQLTIPAGSTRFRVVAINNVTGARSEEVSGVYSVQTVVYSYSFDGNPDVVPIIEAHQRSSFIQSSTGWRWTGFTPKPADYDPTVPAPGEEYKNPDETLYLDTGTGPHIQFSGRVTGSGNTPGAYAYALVSSTGSSTQSDASLDNLQNTSVEIGSEGGPWPYLPGTVAKAGSPYPEGLRLLMRDAAGVWYLSTSDTAAVAQKSSNFEFGKLSALHWQRLDSASQVILNSAPNPDATQGAIGVDSALVQPDLSHITGTGVYVDSVANETSYLRFRGMTFIQS